MARRQSLGGIAIGLALVAAIGPRDRKAVADEAPAANEPEVHVVGIYEGSVETDGKIHGPQASVTVDRPGKQVVLVLNSYGPVTWHFAVTGGTQVQKVILAGRLPQAVKGLADEVTVVRLQDGSEPTTLPLCYDRDSCDFVPLVRRACKLTSTDRVSSFHGAYIALKPFVVDRVDADKKLGAHYPEPTPLAMLPAAVQSLRFKSHHYVDGARIGVGPLVSYGDFTLAGPVEDTLVPLPAGVTRLALDPVAKQWYGIQGNDVVTVDLMHKETEKMEFGLDVPPLSVPCEITFDTKRRRLIVGSSAGGGYLYAYTPDKGEWTVISRRPGWLDAFAYSECDDCLWGVLFELGRENQASLAKVNSQGAIVRELRLRDPVLPGSLTTGPGVCSTRIVPADGYVVILTAPGAHFGGSTVVDSYIYLVDTSSGESWVTKAQTSTD